MCIVKFQAQQATMAAEAQKGQMTTFQTDLARAEKEIDVRQIKMFFTVNIRRIHCCDFCMSRSTEAEKENGVH